MELDRVWGSRISRLSPQLREALCAKATLLEVEEHPSTGNHQRFRAAVTRLTLALRELAGSRLIESET